MAMRLLALRAGRPLHTERFLVLIYVRSWVNPRVIMQLEGWGKLNNPMTSSRYDPAIFRLVTWDFNHHFYIIILDKYMLNSLFPWECTYYMIICISPEFIIFYVCSVLRCITYGLVDRQVGAVSLWTVGLVPVCSDSFMFLNNFK
jgi:hypothetical protein